MGVLYFLSIIATPLFFMIIGYIDSSDEIDQADILRKLKSIITIIISGTCFSTLSMRMASSGAISYKAGFYSVLLLFI